jgi:UDP-N-acetylglucosamine 2-epimerase (non-hydrolysing)
MAKIIHLVMAARPNFMKIAPLYHLLKKEDWCAPVLVHTGQHYDAGMSDWFLRDLGLPAPDIHLGIGSGSHAEQTGRVMVAYEKICLENRPDFTLVVGDVNSTLACAIAAKKLVLPVGHLEAGLRSFDRRMPEEVNRVIADLLSDILWTPSADADANLACEGIGPERISRVGNIMIDALELLHEKIAAEKTAAGFGLEAGGFGVATLHRPSNVDDAGPLGALVEQLVAIAARVPLVFPVHPRTRQRLEQFGLLEQLMGAKGMHLCEPMGYVRFVGLVREAAFAITDSGGLQGETTYIGVPCLTMRENTEQPVTISEGTNRLVAPDGLAGAVADVLAGRWPRGRVPTLWDGQTAARVLTDLRKFLSVH